MKKILALDQGTTSSRALVFDPDGTVRASAQREFAQHFPQPGWVEHDPREIWASQRDVAAAALAQAQTGTGDLAAIGITNQRETTLIWDRASGQPIAPAIVWQDRRTAAICDDLRRSGHSETIRDKTGLVLDAYFSGSKVKWLLDHVSGARGRAERGELAFGTIDSWLVYQLTGGKVHATDVSNASRTLLFNIHTLDWDDELLALLDIPRPLLPKIVSSSGIIGETTCDGLPGGIPIAGIAGDQQAALFGQACFSAGMAKNTYGTGCFMLMNTGAAPCKSQHNLITTVAWRLGNDPATYALEGSVFIAGAAVQWLRDGLGLIRHASEMEALARSVENSGDVVFVPAFSGLGAPDWDPRARGLLIGMTRGTHRGHIARATLEAIALQSVELARAMQKDAGAPLVELRVDGGATVNDLLMQIQADLGGIPVIRPSVTESTARGAAFLAGLAVGIWKDLAQIKALWQVDRAFRPELPKGAADAALLRWREAVDRAKSWSRA
ncbi:MAG TPA: glycerol kinase GlpK [Usitatibacteraceae bacterium]|nr:glycerol kinase GlpK [Usitatibacteraceae bacterium]